MKKIYPQCKLLVMSCGSKMITAISALWVFFMFLLLSADFFKNNFFQNILSGTLSGFQTILIHSVSPHLGPNCLQWLSD